MRLGVVVAGGVHRLRQVDDHRRPSVRMAQQDVELRQVAMHHAGAQHAHHLAQQRGMVDARGLVGVKLMSFRRGAASPWASHTSSISSTPSWKLYRLRHPHAGTGQAVQRVDLGALPGGFHAPGGQTSCPWPWRGPGG
jgi:Ni/Co efflux regulator RcnB